MAILRNLPANIVSEIGVKVQFATHEEWRQNLRNGLSCSMSLVLISACVRFPANILLHCIKNTYLLLHLFIKSCLPGTQGRTLLFYFNYKTLFLLPNNTFYFITLFHIPWGSIILLLYCI